VRKERMTTKRRLNTKLLARLKKAYNNKESQSVTYKGLRRMMMKLAQTMNRARKIVFIARKHFQTPKLVKVA
jgi:hypothetical protein